MLEELGPTQPCVTPRNTRAVACALAALVRLHAPGYFLFSTTDIEITVIALTPRPFLHEIFGNERVRHFTYPVPRHGTVLLSTH